MSRPILALSAGDPAGIGPEIILKALSTPHPEFEPLVVGSEEVFRHLSKKLGIQQNFEVLDVCEGLDPDAVLPGQASATSAEIQERTFAQALDLVDSGRADAIVTAPWTKSLRPLIGLEASGHTEILAARYNAPNHVMMLAGPRLRVALVTTHLALRAVPDAVVGPKIERVVRTCVEDLARFFGVTRPKIAVLGLNPHAGENGHMGMEEIETITPAIERLRAQMPDVTFSGPHPADTLFAKFHGQEAPYDAVIAMYHDQGLVGLKSIHFGQAINITLGLPILRTSVDHGSAWDIAWQGRANADSMRYAMDAAVECARLRSEYGRTS